MPKYDLRNRRLVANVVRAASMLTANWQGIEHFGIEKLTATEVHDRIAWLMTELGGALWELIPLKERDELQKQFEKFLREGVEDPLGNKVKLDPKGVERMEGKHLPPNLPGTPEKGDPPPSTFSFEVSKSKAPAKPANPLTDEEIRHIALYIQSLPKFRLSIPDGAGPEPAVMTFKFAARAPTIVRRLLATIASLKADK